MRKSLAGLVILSMTLSACGGWRDSRVNPSNWFGNSRSEPVDESPAQTNPLIPENTSIFRRRAVEEVYDGTPVDQITALSLERTSIGAIIRVEGVTLRQGAYDVRLTSDTEWAPVNGVLELTLAAIQPDDMPQGPERSRTVTAGRALSAKDLQEISTIRVTGARNVMTSGR
jgi:hypothetical protein